MNKIKKILSKKKTENGDVAYSTTGDNLSDLFFMTPFFEKHLDQAKIGTSEKEKVFSMFIRDPRFGLGKRDLGRVLMEQSGVDPANIVKAGRFDDLYHIPTDENIEYLRKEIQSGNELAKKWAPRLQSSNEDRKIALALCDMWELTPAKYRKLIKTDSTVEYKLSYAEKAEGETPLNDLFKQGKYRHPLVDKIDFEKVPSLAMTKYMHTFSCREDLKERFAEYINRVKENKAKVHTATATVVEAKKVVDNGWTTQGVEEEARDVVGKKIVENATLGVEINAIPILDTSGSMGWLGNQNSLLNKAMAIAHAIAIKSTYARNQIISFSSRPQLMEIHGRTLKEQYESMYTGDCSNTDFGAVMRILRNLAKFPKYLIVISDMEFDWGSNTSKADTMRLFKQNGADTKIVWWNLNDRNKTVPEFDEYGNIFLSGHNMQLLKLLETGFNMSEYIDKVLEKYKKDIDY